MQYIEAFAGCREGVRGECEEVEGAKTMMKTLLRVSCLGAALALASSIAAAQEIVHAL